MIQPHRTLEERQLDLFAAAAAPVAEVGPAPKAPAAAAAPVEELVGAPVAELRALDVQLAEAGPPLAEEWPVSSRVHVEPTPASSPPADHHDGLDELRAKQDEILRRGARGRREARRTVLPSHVEDRERLALRAAALDQAVLAEGLGDDEKARAMRLDEEVLVDGRSWLELTWHATRAERARLVDVLRLQRGPSPLSAGAARAALFHTLRLLTPRVSQARIATVWGCARGTVAAGEQEHEARLAREAMPPPAPSAERAVDDGGSPPVPDRERWIEREDGDSGPPDLAELPAKERARAS